MPDVFDVTMALGGDFLDFGEQFLFRLRLFEDDLNDPIAVGEQIQMVGGVADPDKCRAIRIHKCSRLVLNRFRESVFRRSGAVRGFWVVRAGDVEKHDGQSRGGAKGGDAVAHHSGANNANFGDTHWSSCGGRHVCQRCRLHCRG